MRNKSYKFRIYPNKDQQVLIAKTFGCVRFLYNKMLEDKIAKYKETKENLYVLPTHYKQAVAGSNFEPFRFVETEGKRYEIERIRKILETADKISEQQGNLVLSNAKSKFLVSAVDEA